MKTAFVLLFLCNLAGIAVWDARKKEIPDRYVLCRCLPTVFAAAVSHDPSIASRLLGGLCVSGLLLLITLAVPGAFGGGDVKLAAAGGLYLGLKQVLVSAVVAFFLGGLYSVGLLAAKKGGRKTSIAFGPFLCAGMAAGALWGNRLADWYIHSSFF